MAHHLQRPRVTRLVVDAMRELYPEELADRSWDNVGLLLDNVELADDKSNVLITNDLTNAVVAEAIDKKVSVIVTYHPFLFRPIRSITLDDPHQRLVLCLARHNIAVYSPHTAVDAKPGGLNDYLVGLFASGGYVPKQVKVVQPVSAGQIENAGYGRLATYTPGIPVTDLVRIVGEELGLAHLMVAWPNVPENELPRERSRLVTKLAVCAGSGHSVLKDCDAQVLVTGEMSHHEALRLTMLGKTVIMVLHSNSERSFLSKHLVPQLQEKLKDQDATIRVFASQEDRDPFEVVEATERLELEG